MDKKIKLSYRIDPVIHKIRLEFERLVLEAIDEEVGDFATNTYLQNKTVSLAKEVGQLEAKVSLLSQEIIDDSDMYLKKLAKLEKDKNYCKDLYNSRLEEINKLEKKLVIKAGPSDGLVKNYKRVLTRNQEIHDFLKSVRREIFNSGSFKIAEDINKFLDELGEVPNE